MRVKVERLQMVVSGPYGPVCEVMISDSEGERTEAVVVGELGFCVCFAKGL